ncbi:MAG: hypothetical protein JXB06_00165 [Spirochaetales bacterium]|nr:hypothetical protein [Spirochaetales bacterium]
MKEDRGPIRLSSIQIDSAGPIGSFRAELAPLTVIYAANERGKTTIVENLVACLFRRRREGMDLRRDFIGASRVTLEGIGDKPAVFTSLAGRKKIDQLVETMGWPFPANLFDLLVVKGAQLEILREQGGLTGGYLKGLLTQERLYETLRDRLPGEVGYTELREGVLAAQRRIGSYKIYEQTRALLTSLEQTAEEFYDSLSRTELAESLSRKALLNRERSELQLAKRHAAYLLRRAMENQEAELQRFGEQEAESLADSVREYARIEQELSDIEREDDARETCEADLRWLEQLRGRYEQCRDRRSNLPQLFSLLAVGSALFGALAAYFLAPGLLPLLLAAAVVSAGLAGVFTFALHRSAHPGAARIEMEEIQNAFLRRFGSPLTTSADFDLAKTRLDRQLGRAQALEARRGAAQASLDTLHAEIRRLLRAAGRPDVPPSQWGELAEQLRDDTRQLRIDCRLTRERLGDLGVDEADYLEQEPEKTYSRRREEEIALELEELEGRIQGEEGRTRELRERLIEHVGAEAARSRSIEALAEAIEEKKQEYRRQVQECLAEMIAGHVVAEVLEGVRSLEDSQLEATLNDPRITALIKKFTAGRWETVRLGGDGLLVENETERYPLEQLSSGAREQILLALRMGLASVICGKRSLFLILDDAFQYSDWQRRRALVHQAVEAVRSGWQVVYLTMDDDIRDRFRRAAEELEPGTFALIEL